MNYYQFHIGDYSSHTSHLSEIEDLAYRRMLDYCYLNECGLPEDIDRIARVIRMPQHCSSIAVVLLEFWTQHSDGTYRQSRIESDLVEMRTRSQAAKEKANKRWEKAYAVAMPQQCQGNATNTNTNTNLVISQNTDAPANAVAKREKNTGSRLHTDWQLPKALGEWAVQQGLTRDSVILEADRFRDYWIAQPGTKGRKSDWPATWRNWIRNRKQDSKSFAQQNQEFKDEKAKEFYKPLLEMSDEDKKAWGFPV